MAYFIASRMSDGVVSEPADSSRVMKVMPDTPQIKSYLEASTEYQVTKPTSTFVLQPTDEFVHWRTDFGASPSSCMLADTMGHLSDLYGFDKQTTAWSASCYNLACPAPGEAPLSAIPKVNL